MAEGTRQSKAYRTTYLASPRWAMKKDAYRASGRPQACLMCGAERVDLHHRTYKRLGRERLTDLVPLCRTHHEAVHDFHAASGLTLEKATARFLGKPETKGGTPLDDAGARARRDAEQERRANAAAEWQKILAERRRTRKRARWKPSER